MKTFKTEEEARKFAREFYDHNPSAIVLSPHEHNTNGDYFVMHESGFVRSWEKVIYEGAGNLA